MARPTVKPRLARLDSAALAQLATEMALQQIARLAQELKPGIAIEISRQGGPTPLAVAASGLCRYAQTGTPAAWNETDQPLDLIGRLTSALYSLDARDRDQKSDWQDAVSDESPLGTVLLAAHGRWLLGRGRDIPAEELAALASVSPGHILVALRPSPPPILARSLSSSSRRTLITAPSALSWLQLRGCPGLLPRGSSGLQRL
jgi:hypothetical protein